MRQGLGHAEPALHREHAEVVVRVAVAGIGAQHVPVQRIGVREAAGLVMRRRLEEQVVQRRAGSARRGVYLGGGGAAMEFTLYQSGFPARGADPVNRSELRPPPCHFQDIILRLQATGANRAAVAAALRHGNGRRHDPHGDVPALDRARALGRGLPAALPPPHRRPLRRQPQPPPALLPVPGAAQALADGIQERYLGSLEALGIHRGDHDIRFVEDNWETPTLGAWGWAGKCGWMAWRSPSSPTSSSAAASTAGRSPSRSPTASSAWPCTSRTWRASGTSGGPSGRRAAQAPAHVPRRLPPERGRAVRRTTSRTSDPERSSALRRPREGGQGSDGEAAGAARLRSGAQGAHTFNLLGARGAISVTERAAYIGRIRNLARAVAQSYFESRERLGFPMLVRCRA